ncbi:histidine phosphatase family protein [Candidatus Pelagibacter sp.]|jgi:phosphohistidine phosphatase SixA|nr:histidine phosphatase family protein [Candidatus Pelagibacter sp.]
MRIIKITLLLLISFNVSFKVISANDLQNIFSGDGKIIFIRHAYAPGGGDPDGFDISNCASQRNLSKEGITQSKNIGKFFSENNIQIDKVLSSEWCRCKQTAKYAFNNYETKSFLNSFFSQKFAHNKDKQVKELKDYIINWEGKKNLILVTHYVVISETLNVSTSSGEIVITDRNFNVLASINTSNN